MKRDKERRKRKKGRNIEKKKWENIFNFFSRICHLPNHRVNGRGSAINRALDGTTYPG
jgi:hypothetical protein